MPESVINTINPWYLLGLLVLAVLAIAIRFVFPRERLRGTENTRIEKWLAEKTKHGQESEARMAIRTYRHLQRVANTARLRGTSVREACEPVLRNLTPMQLILVQDVVLISDDAEVRNAVVQFGLDTFLERR